MWWMNLIAYAALFGVKIASLWNNKLRQWVDGRKNLPERIAEIIQPKDEVIWFHAASYGEFEEGRPLIERIRREHPAYKIIVTFFSPSGYVAHKNYPSADGVFYLPADISSHVKKFLDALRPKIAVFVKYEFWLNLLTELEKREIKTYVISARFIPDSRFFKWYGKPFRKALQVFDTLFVQDDDSVELLSSIGINQVVKAGDPRFDRVKTISETAWRDEIIENFKHNDKVFIAGSVVDDMEFSLLQNLINGHPDTKFLIVPHEMDREPMLKMIAETHCEAKLYSDCDAKTDFKNTQVLIVNTIGMLSKLYRYGNWAFIGGGFDLGIHSVIEATVYGLPAVFGPNYAKNRPGIEMVEIGACASITDFQELAAWFAPIEFDDEKLEKMSRMVFDYTHGNSGATDIILSKILP